MTHAPSSATLLAARIDSALAPWEALLLLREDPRPFALVGAWAGSRAILGSAPVEVASTPEDPFAVLDAQPKVDGRQGCVGGGWFGYLGYQLGHLVERLPPPPPRPAPLPLAELAFYDHLLRLDREGRWWFEALVTEERRSVLEERLEELRERLGRRGPSAHAYDCGPFVPRPGRSGHVRAVEQAKRHIVAGDIYQANVCLRLESELRGDPLDLYCTALAQLEPRYSAFFRTGGGAVASLSPELFLRRSGGRVRSEPIKGTAPRVDDPGRAERARVELLRSVKDRAENVMIVDLMRSDLGRVCRTGSVQVPGLATAEAHAGVWHLV
jgi:anthranilate/para-aminobenzoate synthase component I